MRVASCPNCGAPVEFRLGASRAIVCGSCSFTVVRDGPTLQTLGKVSDLVPTSPPLRVGDTGAIGGRPFRVGGRVQLSQGAAPWDEFFVEFSDGAWGWLAKAQGGWMLTWPFTIHSPPHPGTLAPGSQIVLGDRGAFVVQERGESTVVSAEGELPFPVRSGERSDFADLSGNGGAFATLDASGTDVRLYLGAHLDPRTLSLPNREGQDALTAMADPSGGVQRVQGGKLACPSCGGNITLRIAESESVSCQYCDALLDHVGGSLALAQRYERAARSLAIPLGSEGTLRGEKVIAIGYMERACNVEGVWYNWRETLLHSDRGFSWLVEDNGHYTHVRSVPPGEVRDHSLGPLHKGVRYKPFSNVLAHCRYVLGEFYWKVRVGETVNAADNIAPPKILSCERSQNEITWSQGEHITQDEIWKGLRLRTRRPPQHGVGVAQPNPVSLYLTGAITALSLGALILAAIVFSLSDRSAQVFSSPIEMPLSAASSPSPIGGTTTGRLVPDRLAGMTSEGKPTFGDTPVPVPDPAQATTDASRFLQLTVPRRTTLAVHVKTPAENVWVGVDCALINTTTNEVTELSVVAEKYSGYTQGESWSEGSGEGTEYVGPVAPGQYLLRYEPQWEPYSGFGGFYSGVGPPAVNMTVTLGERSPVCFVFSFVLLLLPIIVVFIRSRSFEGRRWYNSNLGGNS